MRPDAAFRVCGCGHSQRRHAEDGEGNCRARRGEEYCGCPEFALAGQVSEPLVAQIEQGRADMAKHADGEVAPLDYAKGGLLPPGVGVVINRHPAPELVEALVPIPLPATEHKHAGWETPVRQTAALDPAAVTRRCNVCGRDLPLAAFTRVKGKPTARRRTCKKCVNGDRTQNRTPEKLLNSRARTRATAELLRLHPNEFQALLDKHRKLVQAEADRLAASPDAARFPDGVVRLTPGPRMSHETVEDRIDVGRCPHCIGYHDRGHACENCGQPPAETAAS